MLINHQVLDVCYSWGASQIISWVWAPVVWNCGAGLRLNCCPRHHLHHHRCSRCLLVRAEAPLARLSDQARVVGREWPEERGIRDRDREREREREWERAGALCPDPAQR